MKKSTIIGLFSILLLTSCSSLTDDEQNTVRRPPTPAEVEQYNAMVPPEDRIICRNEVPIASNIPRRVCRLVRDVEETSTFHREQLRRALR
jgi:PBP1b-binding outer membrane lipoprotein LpoB